MRACSSKATAVVSPSLDALFRNLSPENYRFTNRRRVTIFLVTSIVRCATLAEKVLPIVCQPQAIFRIRPVNCSETISGFLIKLNLLTVCFGGHIGHVYPISRIKKCREKTKLRNYQNVPKRYNSASAEVHIPYIIHYIKT
ncbi:hypothetical protein VNO80_08790 [Phaseolus coccineus]|uniref:Uncharacterized protein n=1 Tax=Phaseolus coccineus TaxID=3886 RepID=A0AAN9NA96_PHACN